MNNFIRKPKFFVFCNVMFFVFSCLKGQDDGVTIPSDTTDQYSFIDNKFKSRKSALTAALYANSTNVTLWHNNIIDGNTGFGLHASYEYKIIKKHSLKIGTQLFITNKKHEYARFYCNYRFYHNLNQRMQRGKTGDNFSANYFFVEPAYFVERTPYRLIDYEWDFDKGEWKFNYKKSVSTFSRIWIGYGLQRNFVSKFYFDLNAGFDFQEIGNINTPYFQLYLFTQLSIGYIIH
jgi:hypothetical protein